MKHDSTVFVTKFLNEKLLATSTPKTFHIWDFNKQENIVVVEDICLTKIIPVNDGIYGIDNSIPESTGGTIFGYKKELPLINDQM